MSVIQELISQPIAHRGLHDGRIIIENTPSAFAAAIEQSYAIECDVQITADGEAIVYHDDELGRLTEGRGRLQEATAAELRRVPFKACADHMIALDELCDLAAGRTPLFIELKSHFDGDRRLVERTAATLSRYRGGAAVMSFDPMQMALLRDIAPSRARGLVAETEPAGKPGFDLGRLRGKTAYAVQVLRMRPQFLAYCVDDLPSTSTSLARNLLGIPILAWTVRDAASRRKADRYADQIIFEGFKP